VRAEVVRCTPNRNGIFARVIALLRFRRELRRCGDFLLEDPPAGSSVREPRRPRPFRPGGAIALQLPHGDDAQ